MLIVRTKKQDSVLDRNVLLKVNRKLDIEIDLDIDKIISILNTKSNFFITISPPGDGSSK